MTTELPTDWLAAMPDVLARLEGIRHPRVADVGCGQGASTLAIASALLDAHVDGFDAAGASVAGARARAAEAGLDGRVRFVCGDAADLAAHGPYDLVLIRETVHDAAVPAAALRGARAALAAGGTAVLAVRTVAAGAAGAGDARAGMLPVDHDGFRLYRLDP